jgi:hypothetical protein
MGKSRRSLDVYPRIHAAPEDPTAVLLPAGVKRRLGLDAAASWIITRVLNRLIWPGYDLRAIARGPPAAFAGVSYPSSAIR